MNSNIKLEHKKMLGFKLNKQAPVTGKQTNQSQKLGSKIGGKVGSKPGVKPT